MNRHRVVSLSIWAGFILSGSTVFGVVDPYAPDLNPVTFRDSPTHDPVILVEDGHARATICVMGTPSRVLRDAVRELGDCIRAATGAELPVVEDRVVSPGIVIGPCAEVMAAGLDPGGMPVEGFAIKTAQDRVFIVGNDDRMEGVPRCQSEGTAWGVYEFLERFVGVRWYYPTVVGGRSIPTTPVLRVPAIYLEDAPVFRKREIYPPCGHPSDGTGIRLTPLHRRLRAGNSWPTSLVVHSPDWGRIEAYRKDRPEVFQMREDGSRNERMLCYGNPRTLETYLEEIERVMDGATPDRKRLGMVGHAVTVSPNDAAVDCRCVACKRLWDKAGGRYGTASRIMSDFVTRLSSAVRVRWPDLVIIYLPYQNYTLAPEGVSFPGNVEVQLCGMPGIAQYKEPAIYAAEQDNLDRWYAATGRKVQNWHYSCWPADKTRAPYQYYHVLKTYYGQNRDKLSGSFINGVRDHWPRQHVSLYCWLKILWDPDVNVDAIAAEYCRRLYGPAADTMHELLTLQSERWENSRWPSGRLSPKAVYEHSFPPPVVARMRELLARARTEAAENDRVLERIDYYAGPFKAFFAEFNRTVHGMGATELTAVKVPENPRIDGRLTDRQWQEAPAVSLVRRDGEREAPAAYPTELRAVWSLDGITFGFANTEPVPDKLVRNIRSRDDPMAWWDDNVEIFVDATGKGEGEFYQFIVNANGMVADLKTKDPTWNADGTQIGVHLGQDVWGLEVYVPYSAFSDMRRPGTGVTWLGQFTRHRIADSKTNPDSKREYTRMNAAFGGGSANLADFAAIHFRE